MAAFNLEGIVGCPCRNEDKFRHVLADPLSGEIELCDVDCPIHIY